MDLAKKDSSININFISYLLYLPGLWLTLHIYRLALKTGNLSSSHTLWSGSTSHDLIEEFKVYRNLFYTGYVIIFIILGLQILLKGISTLMTKKDKMVKDGFVSILMPKAILGLIFVTFSYAIAGLLIDLTLLIGRFI